MWNAILGTLGVIVLGVGMAYWKRFLALFDPHLDRHIDKILEWGSRRVPFVRKLRRAPRALAAAPDPEPERPKPLPTKPKKQRASKSPAERETTAEIPIPSFFPNQLNAVDVEYGVRWEWEGDFVIGLEVLCPNCGEVLNRRPDSRIALSQSYTLVECWKCGFSASIGATMVGLENTLKQTIYRVHRQSGRL